MTLRLGFLTAPHLPDLTPDDRLVLPYLKSLGIAVEPVIWTEAFEAERYQALIMRSCWDYHLTVDAFRDWLNQLQELSCPVLNSPEVMLANLDKRYLLELSEQGVAIVPSLWLKPEHSTPEHSTPEHGTDLPALIEQQGWPEAVIKPLVSGNGYQTLRLQAGQALPEALQNPQHAGFLVQPFVESIQTEGEWSLIFFAGQFSHAVNKLPARDGFLIHEEHGGSTRALPVPPELLRQACHLAQTRPDWLYARLDYVWYDQRWCLSELELIEPHLYLGYEAAAASRWALALQAFLQTLNP